MANSTGHALPYPILNARFSLALPFRVSAGTPTDPTTPDTEFSTDGGATFSDCAEEITTGGTNGMGYLTLTGAETNNSILLIAGKSANCVETPCILYPRRLATVGSGTLSAGSAGGGTLGTLLAYDVTGCFIRSTGGTGGGGTGGANNQARKIATYNTSTGAFTVSPNWETTPDATTTYDVLLPEGVTLGMLRTINPTTAGRTLDVSATGEAGLDWANIGSPTTSVALTGTTIATTQQVDVNTIKTQSVTCSAGVTVGAFVGNATAAIVIDASGRVDVVKIGGTSQTAGDIFGRLGNPAAASIAADIANVQTTATAVSGRIPAALVGGKIDCSVGAYASGMHVTIQKNTALTGFMFEMIDSSDHFTAKTGLGTGITCQVAIDGGSFASLTNTASEISAGTYTIDLAAADLNGNNIVLKFTCAGADPTKIYIKTQP